MFSGRTSLSLALTCGVGLFSVGCLSKKNEEVTEAAAPPPAAYPGDPAGYAGTTGAPAPGAYGGTSAAPAPASPPQPAPFELRDNEELVTHLIVSGESLTSIAGKYNSSISRIMSANGMSDTLIYAGKSLQIPVVKSSQVAMSGGTGSAPAPAPQTGYGTSTGGYQPTTTAPVYPGTTTNPSSTSYPRQTAPVAPTGSFPTPSF